MKLRMEIIRNVAIVAGACFAGAAMGIVIAGYEGMIFGAIIGVVIGCAWQYWERRVL